MISYSILWNAWYYGKHFTIYLVLANQLFQSYFCEGEPSPPILTPWGAYSSASLTWHTPLQLFVIMTSSPYTKRVRNPIVRHESHGPLMVFNVHQSHRHDTHTQGFFTNSGTTSICGVQHSLTYSYITLWSNACRKVTHPCISWSHDCLTSVITRKTFAPCYVSPLLVKH